MSFNKGDLVRCVETGTVNDQPHVMEGQIYTVIRSSGNTTYVDCCEYHVKVGGGWWTSRFELVENKPVDFGSLWRMLELMQGKLAS